MTKLLVDKLSDYFQKDNRNFNRYKFKLKAMDDINISDKKEVV